MLFVSQRYIPLPPPDWRYSDLVRAFFLSLARKNLATQDLENILKQLLDPLHVMVTNLGRTALTIGLKALGLEKGSRIILPTLVCPTVVRAILKTDCHPLLVDVEQNLHMSVNTLSSGHLNQARAVLVPHLYGLCAPINEIQEWAWSSGLYLIDDAAQSAGICFNGKQLGTFGDFGILSFGPFKSLSTSRGGALISAQENIISTAKQYDMPQEKLAEALRRLISGTIKFHWRPLFLRMSNELKNKKNQRYFETSGHEQSSDETCKLPDLEACLIQLVLARTKKIIARRQETAHRVWTVLKQFQKFEYVGPNNAPYIKIPIRSQGNLTAEGAVRTLRSMHIEAERIYYPLHMRREYKPYVHHPLPIAEEIWERVFLIPNPVFPGYLGLKRLGEAFRALSTN